jgi:hypothetical protein
VHPDGSRLDPHLPGDGVGVQVKEDPQRDHLTLPAWQAPYRGQQGGVQAAGQVVRSSYVVISKAPVFSAVRTTHARGAGWWLTVRHDIQALVNASAT